ncbi:polycystin family receptor for egg jelly-like isoform X2 [Clavelina lepadiformis]|uniref:polycystin family receptor for egg jelly-like isoform X2 n=1 Tax=Clavelina lepadiformis TaxID=159417 RepID=UPI004042497A
MKTTRFFQLCLAVSFTVGCADCSIMLRNASGKIDFPTAQECDNNVMLPHTTTWEIPLKEGEVAYLQFGEVLFSCAEATLKLNPSEDNYRICGSLKPLTFPYYLFRKTVVVSVQRFTKNCSEAKMSFVYNRIGFRIRMDNTMENIHVGQKVSFIAVLSGANDLNLDCEVHYNSTKRSHLSTDTLTTERVFDYSGIYSVQAQCDLDGGVDSFKTNVIVFNVEDSLSASKLKISHEQSTHTYPASAELIFHHKYYFPISYALMLNDIIITELQTSQTFDEKKVSSNETAKFELNSTMQRLVGPGIHYVTLLLQNHVSSVTFLTPVTFNEEIKNLKVMTKQYVGLQPNSFIISATVSQGAPVNLSIDIKSTQTSFTVYKTSIFCPRDCHSMVVEATLSRAGMYKVEATARNKISMTMSNTTFEALPQIFDVYITSRGFNFETRREVFVFIRGDVGKYEMNLTIGENTAKNSTLTISKSEYEHKGLPNLPFDAKPYKLIKDESIFNEARQVTVLIRNDKQTFRFVGNVPKALQTSCLESVRIRDGKVGGGLDEPLKVVEELVLSVDLNFICVRELFSVDYKWRAYRVTSKVDIPKTGDEVQLNASSVEPELLIEADALLPGLYVIKVYANITSDDYHMSLANGDDFTLVEIPKRKLNFLIKGGNVVEAGINTTVLKFESSIDFTKHEGNIKRDWFCAVTQEDLPMTIEIGKIQRKGSCFNWKTLWVSGNDTLEISRNKLIPSEQYYVRLIISGAHYDATFADQKIIIKSKPAPVVILRCWSNCEKLFSSLKPIILQLECDDCIRHTWMLSLKSGQQMSLCKNQRFCKLNKSILDKVKTSSNVTGTGYNSVGDKASATLILAPLLPPSGGICKVHPRSGIAYVTKFNVTCHGYAQGRVPLKYKFFTAEKDQNNLLQHGCDPNLNDVTFPSKSSFSDVMIWVEICGPGQACTVKNLSVLLTKNHHDNTDVISDLFNAISSQNLQQTAQLMLPMSSANILERFQISKVYERVAKYPIKTLMSVKQLADVVRHLVDGFGVINDYHVRLIAKIMDRIEHTVRNPSTSDDDDDVIRSIAASCIFVTSHLMQFSDDISFKIKESSRMTRLGKLLMVSLIPGEDTMTFGTKSVKGKFLKLNNDVINPLNGSSSFRLPNIQTLNNEVINVEVFTYDSSINFNTRTHKVDQVTSVSMTTGWQNEIPINRNEAKNQTIGFPLPAQPGKANITMRVESECDVAGCHSKAAGWALFDWMLYKRDGNDLFLTIHVENMDQKIRNCTMSLQTTDQGSFKLKKEFHEKELLYTWSISERSLPHRQVELNLTVFVDLGAGFYRIGSLINVTLTSFILNCLHWEDRMRDWGESSCKVHQNAGIFNCECDVDQVTTNRVKRSGEEEIPQIIYASHLLVFPNKINYDQLSWNLWEQFQQNPVIISVLLVFYVIYALLLIWARCKDKDAQKKGLFIEVADNSPNDQYRYYVTIYTGSRPNAGTTATVSMRLLGKRQRSNAHVIQRENENVLSVGSVESFLITTPRSLGDIKAVRMWRNDGGSSPKWYLERMVVRDLETNECWFFLCGTRFSDVTEYTFRAATLEELQVSNKLFLLKCENHFKDRHVWYSLYGMRPWQHGVMTRVERAATCSLFIFMVMITSMMFHGHSHALDGNVLTFGHYSFKWSHIAVGIQSALICFPGPFFISLMFRHAQRRKGNKNLISGNNLESPKLTRGQQNPATSLVQNHDAQKTGNTIKQNNRNRSERENAKVDQNKNKIGQYIPEDNDRPSISREIANIINKQPPKFPGKFEIVNETKRLEKTRRNDLSMKKKINSSRVEGDVTTTTSPKSMMSTKMIKYIPSRVERNAAALSPPVRDMTSPKMTKYIPSHVNQNMATTTSSAVDMTSSKKKKTKPSRDEQLVATTSTAEKGMTAPKSRELKATRVDKNVITTSSAVKGMTSANKKKSKASRVEKKGATTSSAVKGVTSQKKKKLKPSPVGKNVATSSSAVKGMTSPKKKKLKPSRVEKNVITTSPVVKGMKSSKKTKSKTSRVEKNGATTSSAEKALTSSAVRPSARPPLSAAEAQQEFTILEIDPNTLDPLAIVHFSIYVAWFYIVAAMIASTVICVLYGMTYGIETCRDWLVSFVSAFIQTVIILESFKVVLIAYFSVLNNPRHDLRDWVPPLPPSVRPRSYVNRGAIRRKQKRELTNPTYRSPTRERTNRKKNTQENIEMRLIKQRVPS